MLKMVAGNKTVQNKQNSPTTQTDTWVKQPLEIQ